MRSHELRGLEDESDFVARRQASRCEAPRAPFQCQSHGHGPRKARPGPATLSASKNHGSPLGPRKRGVSPILAHSRSVSLLGRNGNRRSLRAHVGHAAAAWLSNQCRATAGMPWPDRLVRASRHCDWFERSSSHLRAEAVAGGVLPWLPPRPGPVWLSRCRYAGYAGAGRARPSGPGVSRQLEAPGSRRTQVFY